jgi:glycosyltransferase involved in cell wall biosynthesis
VSDAPTVSIVVPAHRHGPQLRRSFASLTATTPPPDELVVVVDGADPDTVAAARAHTDHVLAIDPARGPAHARNAGARAASGDVVFFVDSDVAVPPGVVAQVRALFADGDVDAVIGSYDDEPPAPGVISQYKNLLNHYVHQHAGTEGFTFWGACGAIRRSLFCELGGFDAARYPKPSVEDIEFGNRLRAAGPRILVAKDLQITHLKRWDAGSLLRSDVCDRALPWSELILSGAGFTDDLNINIEGRAKVVLAGAAVAGAAAGLRWRPARVAGLGGLVGLAALDRGLIAFFHAKRGPVFTAQAMAWHWLSYLYSGAAFAFALARHARRAPTR